MPRLEQPLVARILELAFPLPNVVTGPNDAAGYKALRALVRSAAGMRGDVVGAAAAALLRPVLRLGTEWTLQQYVRAFDKRSLAAADIRTIVIPRRDALDGDRARMLTILARCSAATTLICDASNPKLLAAADINLPALRELLLRSGPSGFSGAGSAEALDVGRIAARHTTLRRLHLVVNAILVAPLGAVSLVPLAHVVELMVTGGRFAPTAFYAPALRVLDISSEMTLSGVASQGLAAACPALEHLTLRAVPLVDLSQLMLELPRTLRSLAIFDSMTNPLRMREARSQAADAIEADMAPARLDVLVIASLVRPFPLFDVADRCAWNELDAACFVHDIELRPILCVRHSPTSLTSRAASH